MPHKLASYHLDLRQSKQLIEKCCIVHLKFRWCLTECLFLPDMQDWLCKREMKQMLKPMCRLMLTLAEEEYEMYYSEVLIVLRWFFWATTKHSLKKVCAWSWFSLHTTNDCYSNVDYQPRFIWLYIGYYRSNINNSWGSYQSFFIMCDS